MIPNKLIITKTLKIQMIKNLKTVHFIGFQYITDSEGTK